MEKDTILHVPSHMEGMLWQCGSCELSFVSKDFLDHHLESRSHQREPFHIPAEWKSQFIDPPQEIYYVEELIDQVPERIYQDVESFIQESRKGVFLEGQRIRIDDESLSVRMPIQENSEDDEEEENSEDDGSDNYNEREDEEHLIIDTANRRNSILCALMKQEEDLMTDSPSLFIPSTDDLEWIRTVWRPLITGKTKKAMKFDDMIHPEVKTALKQGTDIPIMFERQVAQTSENYAYGLKFVAEWYQHEARKAGNSNFVLRYADFLDFGNSERHVCLGDPSDYIKNQWESGSPHQKKQFIAAHTHLLKIVKDHCLIPAGLEKFKKLFGNNQYANTNAIMAQQAYLKLLRDLGDQSKDTELSKFINLKIEAQTANTERRRASIWANNYGVHKSEEVQMNIKKFLECEATENAQKILITQGTKGNDKSKLSTEDWMTVTRNRVMEIQVQHGGRLELPNMTLGEWWHREEDKDALQYTVMIRRDWTKLAGYRNEPPFLLLNAFDEALCIFYERARIIQFPQLYEGNQLDLLNQPFFVNSVGSAYIRKKHGLGQEHMNLWSAVTGKNESSRTFRKALSNYSLNTDEVTRLNIAFANQHSRGTMERIYATINEKSKAGADALLKYRNDGLKLNFETKTKEGETYKGGMKHTKEQALGKLIQWKKNLFDQLEKEKKSDGDKEKRDFRFGTSESRSAIIELCSTEVQSGQPIGKCYIADFLLRRGKNVINGRRHSKQEIHQAILNVIDSRRFHDCPSSISLRKIMVKVAKNRDIVIRDNHHEKEAAIDKVESDCLQSWRQQLNKLASGGVGQDVRITWAMLQMQEATGEKIYSLANNTIQTNIDNMVVKKAKLEEQVVTIEKNIDAKQMSPGEVIKLHMRKSPMEIRNMVEKIEKKEEKGSSKKRKGAARKLEFKD